MITYINRHISHYTDSLCPSIITNFLPLPLKQELLSNEYIYLHKRSIFEKSEEVRVQMGKRVKEILQIPFCFDKFLPEQQGGDFSMIQATHTN